MDIAKIILLINVFSTFFMLGVIWLVQIVNYPLFAKVGQEFKAYHKCHVRWITYVVAVPMLFEAVSSLMMLWYPYPGISVKLIYLGIILIFIIWIPTILFSVPNHDQLVNGFQWVYFKRLLYFNWIRVMAWTLRAVLVIVIIAGLI